MIPKKSLDSVLDQSIILTKTAPNDNAKSISVQCGGGASNYPRPFGWGVLLFRPKSRGDIASPSLISTALQSTMYVWHLLWLWSFSEGCHSLLVPSSLTLEHFCSFRIDCTVGLLNPNPFNISKSKILCWILNSFTHPNPGLAWNCMGYLMSLYAKIMYIVKEK